MRKQLLMSIFIGSLSYFAHAQQIGGGLAYGSGIRTGGLSLNGEFNLMNRVALSPGVIAYFREMVEVNGNVTWMLRESSSFVPYLITGVNMIVSAINPLFGINAGIGSNFSFGGRSRPFAEVKYVLGDADQLVLLGGVKFPLNIN